MQGQFADLLSGLLWQTLFVFCRVGSALMVMTGFAEAYVPTRLRMGLAIMLSLIIVPLLGERLPALPTDVGRLVQLVAGEAGVGLFLGLVTQILMSSLTSAGTFIALTSGLSNAFLFNPATAQQSAIPAAFLGAFGLLLVFVTNTHHLLLQGVVGSYDKFPPGVFPPVGDLSRTVIDLISGSFLIALQISAPFLFATLVFNMGLGVIARLIPQVQIFFISVPVQIVLTFLIFVTCLSVALDWFIQYFEGNVETYLLR